MRSIAALFLFFALASGLVLAGAGSISLAQATDEASLEAVDPGDEAFTPVVVSTIVSDTAPVLASDGRAYVSYDLVLTNTVPGPAEIEGITVVDASDGREKLTFSGQELVDNEFLRLLDREPAADMTIPENESRVLLLTIAFDDEADVPAAIEHRLDISSPNVFTNEPAPFSYLAGMLDLSRRAAPVLSPPLEGDGWVAAEGCCSPISHHRNGVFPINGSLHAGQRFAIDFIQIDDKGRLFSGDVAEYANWPAYGAPVLAAANGVVISTLDGLPDQFPGIMPDQSRMSLAEIEGNHVVLDHGDGFYTFYGHLEPGSVAITVGDQVTRGAQIARVGNSGGSQVPHLHFHVVDSRNPSAGNGFPFVFDRFELAGEADFNELLGVIEGTATFPSREERTPEARENEMPLTYTIVNFPEP